MVEKPKKKTVIKDKTPDVITRNNTESVHVSERTAKRLLHKKPDL